MGCCWSEMTLNYRVMVEGYPNLKEEVGGSNLAVKSPLYLTENLPVGELPPVVWCWPIGLLSQKKKKKMGCYLGHPHMRLAKLIGGYLSLPNMKDP